METIKISQESLDAFKKEKKMLPAQIDNKNLLEDPFEDEVFGDFYAASDHRDGSRTRHLFGSLKLDTDDYYVDGFVEAMWKYGEAWLRISLKAVPPTEDFEEMRKDCYEYYTKIFKSWECPDNEGLVVKTSVIAGSVLLIRFYFEVD